MPKADPAQALKTLTDRLGLNPLEHKMPGFTMSTIFFEPDVEMIKWLGGYAAGRMIVDVGCGSAYVIRMLHKHGFPRVCGIEPHWDLTETHNYYHQAGALIQVMPSFAEEDSIRSFFTNAHDVLFLLCRPSHGGWARRIPELIQAGAGNELLLISRRETQEQYQDLGSYQDKLVEIAHQGKSKANETVWSLTF